MKTQLSHILGILRWDLRATLAVILGLAIVVGLSLAADDALYAFDFGTASFADVQPGDIRVSGGVSLYPQTSGSITFGWVGAAIAEFSDGSSVSDARRRDRNGGQAPNGFRVVGLPAGAYQFSALVGTAAGTVSTRMTIGERTTSITRTGSWGTMVLTAEVTSDEVEIEFTSADGTNSWGVNALLINPAAGVVSPASFAMTAVPAGQQIAAGGAVAFDIGITPVNNYASPVQLSATGLAGGLTAEFIPPQITTLPGKSELRIRTLASTPPTTYTLLIRAVGQDSQSVTKTASIQVMILAPSTSLDSTTPPLDLRTDQQIRDEFALVEAYVRDVENRRLVAPSEIAGLITINDTMSSFPLGTFELPEPQTPFEATLQFLTRSGIIDSTVSTAPRSDQRAPDRLGFWARFWGSVSSPVT